MRLLVLHPDREVGEGLVAMLREFTTHEVDWFCDAATATVSLRNSRCDVLLAELAGGLAVLHSLGEESLPREIFFLPGYARTEQRLEVTLTRVFPEPIARERLLQALAL